MAGVLLVATVLQSMIGFGMGLVVVPALVWSGVSLPNAVGTLIGGALAQIGFGLYRLRHSVDRGDAAHVGVAAWIAIPIGVGVMALLTQTEPDDIRRGVGIAVIAAVTARLLLRPQPRQRLARPWAWLAGASSGFLAGLVGMGGPPLALFAMANDWSIDRFRSFLWMQFLIAFPILLGVLVWRFGTDVIVHVGIGLLCTPVSWVGTRIGIAATKRWAPERLRLAATIVLYAIGISGIL